MHPITRDLDSEDCTKKGDFWEVGVGDWQSTQDFEFADEQVLGEG